jgi:hypothetical protein
MADQPGVGLDLVSDETSFLYAPAAKSDYRVDQKIGVA